MDTQSAQNPASTTYARPCQPEYSPAAALPTETLQHILKLAVEGEEDPFERQSTRRSFSKVCYHWYNVVPAATEYAVLSATESSRLALKLTQADKQGNTVRSIAIRLSSAGTVNRSRRTAVLLDACRNVEHLFIDFESALSAVHDEAGSFGAGLFKAMKKLRGLRVLELRNQAFVTLSVLAEMFKAWPLLHSLRIHSRLATHPWQRVSLASLGTASALRHLDISGDVDLINHLLPHLRRSKVPLSLVVRKRPGDEPLPTTDVAIALGLIANRLVKFSAPDGWLWSASFRFTLLAMKNLHTLELHYAIIKDAHLVLKLHQLAELRSLSIVGEATSTEECSGLPVEWILSLLPPTFQSLALPRQHAQLWTPAETKAFETRAEQSQFEIVWT